MNLLSIGYSHEQFGSNITGACRKHAALKGHSSLV